MGFDIGLKLNKAIASDDIKKQFYPHDDENTNDEIFCLTRAYCNMILTQHFTDSEPIISELSRVLQFDCSFLEEPKANHSEEDESTRFQFGWVNSFHFLDNLMQLKDTIQTQPNFSKNLNLNYNWTYYFTKQEEEDFFKDIDNLIKVLEVAHSQGVTEICYSVV